LAVFFAARLVAFFAVRGAGFFAARLGAFFVTRLAVFFAARLVAFFAVRLAALRFGVFRRAALVGAEPRAFRPDVVRAPPVRRDEVFFMAVFTLEISRKP
jgi:hypothetical protein